MIVLLVWIQFEFTGFIFFLTFVKNIVKEYN